MKVIEHVASLGQICILKQAKAFVHSQKPGANEQLTWWYFPVLYLENQD